MTADMNMGISQKEREEIAGHLSRLLADTYLLYLKTHNFHWNVTGPQFDSLHLLFEGQYTELALAVDEIAERIRALGAFAPGSFATYLKLASIREEEGHPEAMQMIEQLTRDHETVAATARSVFPLASKVHDEATADLLTERLRFHEKTAWMLRSHLS
ncbi:MAG: putative dna-binding stress protein [Gammaproteobacteria bacterium]|nr:putative dna-binding stress protein [Gammaproteobacteria bacterium]